MQNLFGRNKHFYDNTNVEEKETMTGYCRRCGSHNVEIFFKNDFVLITMPKRAPFYGKVVRTESTDDGPTVIIERGAGEKEPVHIDYITSLGEQ